MNIRLDDEIALYKKKVDFYKDYPVTNDIMVRELKIFLVLLEQLKNERPQGEWERVGHIADRMCFKCSECGRQIYVTFGEEDKYPFCHCGADMRGGKGK